MDHRSIFTIEVHENQDHFTGMKDLERALGDDDGTKTTTGRGEAALTGGETLTSIFEWIWNELEASVSEGGHPFRLPVVATVTPDGGPAARIVVLRRVESDTGVLEFHTDSRSAKIEDLRHGDELTWVVWEPSRQVQVRLQSKASIHLADSVVDSRWSVCPIQNQRNYLRRLSPGSLLSDPQELSLLATDAEERQTRGSERSHFAVVRATVDHIDFYEINEALQRRAWFVRSVAGWSMSWRLP